MKTYRALIFGLILSVYGATAYAQKFTDSAHFRVSRIGQPLAEEKREKLIELFRLVQLNYNNASGVIENKPPPEIASMQNISGRVIQHMGDGMYLIREHGRATVDYQGNFLGGGRTIAYKPTNDPNWVDNERVSIFAMENGTLDYTTVMGSNSRVAFFSDPENLTGLISRDQFLEALRSGHVFTVKKTELRSCPTCKGFGFHRGNRERGQNPDSRYPCRDCASGNQGKANFQVTYRISWE